MKEERFIRRKGARAFGPGFSRHKSGVQWYVPTVCQRGYTGAAWRNGVRLCGDASKTRDIRVPVRPWRDGPLRAYVTRGRSHETPLDTGPMPKKILRRSRNPTTVA